jgi:acyl carrier protein
MTPQTLAGTLELVVDAIVEIAPDLEGTEIPAEAELQADLGLDSMDFMNLMAALSEALAADMPERDYSQLETVESCAAYLHERAAAP